jgi:hypothetical protein
MLFRKEELERALSDYSFGIILTCHQSSRLIRSQNVAL